ncbi:23S rRNA (uracil1939-C5)-methyltransferase [Allopseudospirillum japonicum]|uniref:23S rRNA (Uracil1939-C5)-methyltransferase n=1 Tax=Allopseudospirillum japonicum TaxID=64971 RepID=A0A1H6R151_9GAMM|nr:23S rRNA (uracil(1939)-C(5))-methyltransferase RlmD [Allopseudospirillum japonicum]SEI48116.1 23S rRNA (uracil1939-C5)-methyltransferase [Allopseudospirillum japonicum]
MASRAHATHITAETWFTIEALTHDGRGLAYHHKTPYFIDNALPQERVQIKILQEQAQGIEARACAWEQTSPQRVLPSCAHYAACGGCQLQHLAIEAQRLHKKAHLAQQLRPLSKKVTQKVVASQLSLKRKPPKKMGPLQSQLPEIQVLTSPAWGYRRRARLGVKWTRTGELLIGFREAKSAHLTGIHACPVLDPRLNALLPSLYTLIPELECKRTLGHLELIAGDAHLGLLVRHLKPLSHRDLQAWRAWGKQHQVALWWQDAQAVTQDPDNSFSLSYQVLDGIALQFQPADFIQVNASINQELVQAVLAALNPQAKMRVLDLFSGLGNFALPLAAQGAQVTAVEGLESLVARGQANAQTYDLAIKWHCADLYQTDAVQTLLNKTQWDAVVLDPPRTGARLVCQNLHPRQVAQVVYISCHPATFARDAQALLTQGYQLQSLAMADMFPQTAHAEVFAHFVPA